jgi:hypothetical protein
MEQLTAEERRATLQRVTRRIIPFAFICYVVAYHQS